MRVNCFRALLLLSCCISFFYVSVGANPRLGPSPRMDDEYVEAFSLGLIGTNVYCFFPALTPMVKHVQLVGGKRVCPLNRRVARRSP